MIKIKFIKDTEKFKIGEIAEASKKSADSAISQGYAELVSEPKETALEKAKQEQREKQAKKEATKELQEETGVEQAKQKEKKHNYTSSIVDVENEILVEQVWNEKDGSKFCVYNNKTGKINYAKDYTYNGKTYIPHEGDELAKKVVVLPVKPEEYGSDKELDNKILTFINKWVDVPEKIQKFGLWNTKRSHVFDKFHTLNYSRIQGDTGVGKSRFLDTFGYIHYKPIFTTGATTPAPLFRMMDKWKGTIVMDEADLKRSDESEDIIKILNQGFEKGKFIFRCDQNDANKIAFFDPFCPKILATRRSFTDKATESRCITHVGTVTKRKDIRLNLDEDFFREAEEIRNMLLMWRFKTFFKINMSAKYNLGDLEPRVKQIVSSYVSLFSSDEEGMKDFKDYMKEYQLELIDERKSSFDGSIVGAIHSLLENGITNITAKKIINEGGFTNKNGTPMNPRSISSSLKSLGFKKSESKKVDGKTERCIPLEQDHLKSIFTRYGYEVTVVTVVTVSSKNKNNTLFDDFKQKVTVEGGLHKDRNLRNSVTPKKDENTNTDTNDTNLKKEELSYSEKVKKKFPGKTITTQ